MQGYKAATLKSAPPKPAPTPTTNTTNNNGVGANGSKKNNSKKKPEKAANGESDGAAPRAPPPGFASKPASPAPVGFSEQEQRLLRHRALFVFRFLVGKAVEVTLVDASRYVGILDCIDPDDFSIVLKNTQRKNADGTASSSSEAAIGSGSTVIFKRRQLAHMAADGVVNYGESAVGVGAIKAAAGFRTDTEISNRSHEHLFGRELESAASWLDPQLDTGELEDTRRRSSSKTNWNQFEANEKLFGVVSTFDENLYTTKLDKSKVSTEKSREAERLAREIERETTGNFHLQEERGQAVHGDEVLDEEARYSSVDRKQTSNLTRSANAYVPPALRNRPNSAGTSGPKHVSPKTQTPPPATTSATTPAKTPVTTPVSTPAPKTAPVAAQPATATIISSPSASPAPKPISFSDAVRGRSAAKPTPVQPPAAPVTATPAPASAKQPTKQQPDQTPATGSPQPQPTEKAAAPTSSPKKATSPSVSKKDAKAAAKPASASSDKKPEAVKSDKKTTVPAKESEQPAKASTTSGTSAAASTTTTSTSTSSTPAPAKKGLNPNAREFKLNASASAFTPKFATPPATSSPYRQPAVGGHYGGHMPAPLPHPAMASMGYSPMPEEWMYDGSGMMMVDETEYAAHAAYMGYGVPMMPNPAMMQPAMYAPMMPPQQNMRVPRGATAAGAGYAPGMYNPRGYYGQHGAVPGMPYPPGAVPPVAGGVPQPPLPPTDPSGGEGGVVDATPSNAETPVKK